MAEFRIIINMANHSLATPYELGPPTHQSDDTEHPKSSQSLGQINIHIIAGIFVVAEFCENGRGICVWRMIGPWIRVVRLFSAFHGALWCTKQRQMYRCIADMVYVEVGQGALGERQSGVLTQHSKTCLQGTLWWQDTL